jgi:hypothetical protein
VGRATRHVFAVDVSRVPSPRRCRTQELGSKRDLAIAMVQSAWVASEDGREDAELKTNEALALFRAIDDEVSIAYSVNMLASAQLQTTVPVASIRKGPSR